ncbi:GNAT family N-acetyltransferase [Caldanaerobius polysaccharolyticus]|uniref:GNAT family N-acetyltransferase n=1 Tax=Caldanaerobius polysaccharolyticus TaxID=44256 RepID=UPI000478CF1D|nr:GNAT family N-acetyltransferase [Caldanaerobius polysaccharolyticus]
MIRALSKNDIDALMNLLRYEKELNIFIIGDILNYGFDSPLIDLWGEFDQHNNITAVLLRYSDSLLFYSRSEYNIEGFCNIIKSLKCKGLAGEKSIIETFSRKIPFKQKREMWFCKLDNSVDVEQYALTKEQYQKIKIISRDNLDFEKIKQLIDLYQSIEEFSNAANIEVLKQDVMSGSSRIYYLEEDGMIVSSARTGAEVSDIAMVLGVGTLKGYRNNGYATLCIKRLCYDLLKEGKSLCLFYDNPAAGKIYKKLGFKEVGKWLMMTI